MTLPVSIGILSWGSHTTLRNTLTSYRDNGLLALTDDVTIYFQEISDTDRSIAAEFGITNILGTSENIGIGAAFTKLVEAAKYDNVLILENDWVLIEERSVVMSELCRLVFSLANNLYDFIRLRHVNFPGDPLYTKQYMGREMDSPEHLLDAVHWRGADLATTFPDQIRFSGVRPPELILDLGYVHGDSFYCNHTNNSFATTKEFYMKNIAPFSGEGNALEGAIRDHWRSAGHRVAHSIPGLFTHQRLDR